MNLTKVLTVLSVNLILIVSAANDDPKSSLVFVIDDTGSMSDDIQQVKSAVNIIFDTVMKTPDSQIENFVLVSFNDPDVRTPTVTRDRDTFKRALNSIVVDGGGTCPEYSMSGIERALQESLPGSYLYVFTDATARDYEKSVQVKALAQKRSCQVTFVLTGQCLNDPASTPIMYEVYEKVADATMGQVFHLGKTDIREILDYVIENIKGRRTPIVSEHIPPGYDNKINFTVDGKMTDVIVSMAGDKPKVNVTDHKGVTPESEHIVEKEKISIIKIKEIKPGTYLATGGSLSDSSVLVTAKTDFNFLHGFSTFKPSTINDTVTRPAPDMISYLSIKLTKGGEDVKLETVSILDMDGNVKAEMDLEIVDEKNNFYITKNFIPPMTMFKIKITGYEIGSKTPITRIASTPIEPQNPTAEKKENKAPTVNIEGDSKVNAEYDEPLQLKCKVNAYPKPDIYWEEKDTKIALPSVVSTVELPYDYIAILDIEKVNNNKTYQCKATNTYGTDLKEITIETKRKLSFTIFEYPKDTTVEYTKNATFLCQVEAYPPATITWYRDAEEMVADDNVDISSDKSVVTIKNMQFYLQGHYMCEVRNEFNRKVYNFGIAISGLVPPRIDKSVTELKVSRGSNTDIKCNVLEGIPKPEINWYFKHAYGEVFQNLKILDNKIHLEKVSLRKSGVYRCVATNVLGRDEHEIEFQVVYPPLIKADDKIIIANNGQQITIRCDADGAPTPTIKWFKDGSLITETEKIHLYRDGSLRLKVSVEDKGTYNCTAANELGEANKSVFLEVFVPPRIDKSVTELKVSRGSNTDIKCNVIEGIPKPEINWYFKHAHVEVLQNLKKSGNTIHLERVTHRKSGVYRCVATNVLGRDEHEIEFQVVYPPLIKADDKIITANNGQEITIRCDADGAPTSTIKWFKDGYLITETEKIHLYRDGSLRLKVSVKDKGTYNCIATNELGEANKSVFLEVFVPPSIKSPELSSIKVKVGEDITLPCRADGNPTPEITWIFYSSDPTVRPKTTKATADSSSMELTHIQLKDDGVYTCVASNAGGSSNISYEVVVNAPPIIENIYPDKTFRAVDGDLVLKIQCPATGRPKPTIIWTKDGRNVPSGSMWYDITEEGTLLIKNIDKVSGGHYVCHANNHLGEDTEIYDVTIDPYPRTESPTSSVLIEKGKSTDVKCDLPHTKIDSLRWYKDGRLLSSGELTIKNAELSDSGLYTCRVSDFSKSRSQSTRVVVGYKPSFTSVEDEDIEFIEEVTTVLYCEADAEPPAKVSWRHNGKEMDLTEMVHMFEAKLSDLGQYICEVTNKFGSIQRTFNVRSEDCLLKIDKEFSGNQPLMATSDLNWPTFETVEGYMRIPRNEYMSLICPSNFTLFPKSYAMAFCDGDTNFRINGEIYKYSDLKCNEEVKPVAKETGWKCLGDDTQMVYIRYEALDSYLDVYAVCLDKINKIPLYTMQKIVRTLSDAAPNNVSWSKSDMQPFDFDDLYNCDLQINTISSDLGKWFHIRDRCCFSKRQLVNPHDMVPGLAQVATYNYLNVVPHWSTCNSANWDEIQQRIRNLVRTTDYSLTVWTGVSKKLELSNSHSLPKKINISDRKNRKQPVPQYLWKVIQDPVTHSSLAIIQVNIPDLSLSEVYKHIHCKDICHKIRWMNNPEWHDVTKGYTYCCKLQEFKAAFGYKNIFYRGHEDILYDISTISDHVLI